MRKAYEAVDGIAKPEAFVTNEQDIAPETLRHALDEAGIQRRVVVVSACYSGGFVPALQDEHTLVITRGRPVLPSSATSTAATRARARTARSRFFMARL